MSPVAEDKDALRASFERFFAAHAAQEPAWLRERRTAAFARYVEKGLPEPRQEAWRHTPVAVLTRTRFEPADATLPAAEDALALVPRDVTNGAELVFVNGRLAPALSRLDPAPGVRVASLRDAAGDEPPSPDRGIGSVLSSSAGVFSDLNTAFAEDGATITIAPGVVVAEPVHLVHVSVPGAAPTVAHQRALVQAGRGSESTLVETFVGAGSGTYLVNAVTEVALEDGACLRHHKLQRDGAAGLHVATLAARIGRNARLFDHAISLGAALARNDIEVRFDGEGGECSLAGLFVVDGQRTCDTHSRLEHARPRCTSRQLYKGIVDQQGRGVFHGLVRVAPGAIGTDAVQTNRNLLLSRQALVHSTPQLEILADDVKCRHGSTTGQLDPTALFYLRSRGIGEAGARSLLTWAFASDVLRELRLPALRRAVERHLQAQLPGVADVQEALS